LYKKKKIKSKRKKTSGICSTPEISKKIYNARGKVKKEELYREIGKYKNLPITQNDLNVIKLGMDINDTIIDVLIRKLNEDIPSNILLTESGFWPTMGKNIN
jgi:Ulp1 family protease